MTTNLEWLRSLDPHELKRWFDSPHGGGGGRMAEIKQCPFCGGEAEVCTWYGGGEHNETVYTVMCDNDACEMNVTTADHLTEAEAIAAWNTRAERTCYRVDVNGYSFRFECSACGYVAIVQNCETRLDELPNYCPKCGARVIA